MHLVKVAGALDDRYCASQQRISKEMKQYHRRTHYTSYEIFSRFLINHLVFPSF